MAFWKEIDDVTKSDYCAINNCGIAADDFLRWLENEKNIGFAERIPAGVIGRSGNNKDGGFIELDNGDLIPHSWVELRGEILDPSGFLPDGSGQFDNLIKTENSMERKKRYKLFDKKGELIEKYENRTLVEENELEKWFDTIFGTKEYHFKIGDIKYEVEIRKTPITFISTNKSQNFYEIEFSRIDPISNIPRQTLTKTNQVDSIDVFLKVFESIEKLYNSGGFDILKFSSVDSEKRTKLYASGIPRIAKKLGLSYAIKYGVVSGINDKDTAYFYLIKNEEKLLNSFRELHSDGNLILYDLSKKNEMLKESRYTIKYDFKVNEIQYKIKYKRLDYFEIFENAPKDQKELDELDYYEVEFCRVDPKSKNCLLDLNPGTMSVGIDVFLKVIDSIKDFKKNHGFDVLLFHAVDSKKRSDTYNLYFPRLAKQLGLSYAFWESNNKFDFQRTFYLIANKPLLLDNWRKEQKLSTGLSFYDLSKNVSEDLITEKTYASYKLEENSAKNLSDWIKKSEIVEPVQSQDLHVTTTYTDKDITLIPSEEKIILKKETFEIKQLGRALVLLVDSPELDEVHKAGIEAGADHKYESYIPHITLSYNFDANENIFPLLFPPDFDIVLSHEEVINEEFEMIGYYKMWGWIDPGGNLILPTKEMRLSRLYTYSHGEILPMNISSSESALKKGYFRFYIDKKDHLYLHTKKIPADFNFDNLLKGYREIENQIVSNEENLSRIFNKKIKLPTEIVLQIGDGDIGDFYHRFGSGVRELNYAIQKYKQEREPFRAKNVKKITQQKEDVPANSTANIPVVPKPMKTFAMFRRKKLEF